MKRSRPVSEARRRLVETADRLFYRDGIRAVGIDRIIAEAGVAKMTLYTHFRSKDELILAVLEHREQTFNAWFTAAMERQGRRHRDPLRAFFAAIREWFASPGFRGCAFINTAVELADPAHPGSRFVQAQKRRFADLLRGLLEGAVGKGAARIAPAVGLLVEGAIVTALIRGTPEAAEAARDAALKMIADVKTKP